MTRAVRGAKVRAPIVDTVFPAVLPFRPIYGCRFSCRGKGVMFWGGGMKVAFGIAAVLAILAVGAAHAADPIGRISLGGSAGLSTYALSDVNHRIAVGNEWLDTKGWRTLDPIDFGWSFWGDIKAQVPMLEDFFISGGYGVSSGESEGPDSNELLTVGVSQSMMFARLLYVLPYRFHRDVRLFVGGGPLFITKQEVRATHEQRTSGGGTGGEVHERIEEVFYKADGVGWQLGVSAEYMVQDRITLALDLGYRWANLDYGDWDEEENVIITDTDPTEFSTGQGPADTSLNRLHGGYPVGNENYDLQEDQSYILKSFLDEDKTRMSEDVHTHHYGPHREYLKGLSKEDLGIDLSGLQVHVGLRFYFL